MTTPLDLLPKSAAWERDNGYAPTCSHCTGAHVGDECAIARAYARGRDDERGQQRPTTVETKPRDPWEHYPGSRPMPHPGTQPARVHPPITCNVGDAVLWIDYSGKRYPAVIESVDDVDGVIISRETRNGSDRRFTWFDNEKSWRCGMVRLDFTHAIAVMPEPPKPNTSETIAPSPCFKCGGTKKIPSHTTHDVICPECKGSGRRQ